jgi:hypothetical protein
MAEYIPGVCNIGRAEVKRRKMAGYVGLAAVVVLWAVLIAARVPPVWRLTLFLPGLLAAIGLVQARMGFCVNYGLLGVFSVGPDAGKTDTVEQAEFRRQDQRKALAILSLSLLIAAALAAAGYFIPV